MAEAELGCHSDVENGVVLVLGTMIGVELLKDGRTTREAIFSAGEVFPLSARRVRKSRIPGI